MNQTGPISIPIELRFRCLGYHQIATGNLDKLARLSRRKMIHGKDEPAMLAAKRDILLYDGCELLSVRHARNLPASAAQKKTSGGVAPIHLRKYATA